jgi:predicted 3-demethylubiquinone-9 3-methyltransferase (glyoxalase superfamily)
MVSITQKITPCLWFDSQAEEAANFYISVFDGGRIKQVSRYGKAGQDVHGREPGSVMVVEFEIAGQTFTALNGGPLFKFSEAVSFQVMCKDQEEIDRFWSKLSDGGRPGQCGWLKDRYGLSWQIVPALLPKMITEARGEQRERIIGAVMGMKKFDVAALQRAAAGEAEKV